MCAEFMRYTEGVDQPALIPKLLTCFSLSELEADGHVPRAKIDARLKQLNITMGNSPDTIVEEGVCMHVCMHVYMSVCVCMQTCFYECAYVCEPAFVSVYVCIYVYS